MSYDDGCREAAARIRELEELRRIDAEASEIVGTMAMQQKARAERAEAERDAVQHLSAQQERHRDELLAENEALRGALIATCILPLWGERKERK